MAVINVMLSELMDAQKQMISEAESYKESVNRIGQILERLQNQWEGDAQVAFEVEQIQAMAFYNQMVKRITACGNGYKYAAGCYEDADKTSANIIKSVNA
jgi:WXG100 family type VII secretion target